jgi:Ni,Fe-hydrogenase III large subunit
MKELLSPMHNGASIPLAKLPAADNDSFFQGVVDALTNGWRVSSYFGVPGSNGAEIFCILSSKANGAIGVARTSVAGSFPSLAEACPQLHLFEREIAEQCALTPVGHPWLKPVRFHRPFGKEESYWHELDGKGLLPGVMPYYQVEGEEVHEVAVGPVHAGIIEPGHFRFQCHGEEVFSLEISLGFQHRGIEQSLPCGPHPQTMYQMETIAGDTSIGHGQAYCMAIEALAKGQVPPRAEVVRGIALELERLANHTGDLGAIAGDVGYLPTASFCGRIRGDFLNMSAVICGSRFGRGLVRPGGVGFECSKNEADELLKRLEAARSDLENAVELLWSTPSVMARLENVGTVSSEVAREICLVGPAARASGLNRDVRRDHPYGIFRMGQIPVVTAQTGDVYARTLLRWLEAERSMNFIAEQLHQLPAGRIMNPPGNLATESLAVALTEGWRGEICHAAITDETGCFRRYKIVDPSFHNWQGLSLALRGQQISDFPLCNKSFNLSYCGFDL